MVIATYIFSPFVHIVHDLNVDVFSLLVTLGWSSVLSVWTPSMGEVLFFDSLGYVLN